MLSLRRWFGLCGVGLAVAGLGLLAWAGPAGAAFPGRNGLLAAEPLKGSGIVLVEASGRSERRVCAHSPNGARLCSLYRPVWSADGRTLVSSLPRGGFVTVFSGGACGECAPPSYLASSPLSDVAFTKDPTLVTAVQPYFGQDRLVEYGVDWQLKKVLLRSQVAGVVWSSGGELAVVRGGWIWEGIPGRLRRLERGSAPSWSPDGSQIVFVRHGWLMVLRLRGSLPRRLVAGAAPAWSPDGRWIAFIGSGRRLSLIRPSGGQVRRVGNVTGVAVDWQPLPPNPPVTCAMPPGTSVAASSGTATLGVDRAPTEFGYTWAALGCLRAHGRSWVLGTGAPAGDQFSSFPSSGVVAGGDAAVIVSGGGKFCPFTASVQLFDLRTGAKVRDRGGESAGGCSGQVSTGNMDQLVLGADAVSAVHVTELETAGPPAGCGCTLEQVIASDRTGVRKLDSTSEPIGSPSSLTNLSLTGDTLTWQHDGIPRRAQLQP